MVRRNWLSKEVECGDYWHSITNMELNLKPCLLRHRRIRGLREVPGVQQSECQQYTLPCCSVTNKEF
jgi:hypothetical protein